MNRQNSAAAAVAQKQKGGCFPLGESLHHSEVFSSFCSKSCSPLLRSFSFHSTVLSD